MGRAARRGAWIAAAAALALLFVGVQAGAADTGSITADPSVTLMGLTRGLVGSPVDYDLTIANRSGDLVWAPITVTVQLPDWMSGPHFNFGNDMNCYPSGCSVRNISCTFPAAGSHTFTCSLQDPFRGIGPGEYTSDRAFFSASATKAGTGTIEARVEPTPGVVDTDPTNNSASLGANAFDGAFPPLADLAVTQTAPATASPNGGITYSVNVQNNGPDAASPVTLSDELPPGFTFIPTSSSAGCSGTTTVMCDVDALESNSSRTVTLVARTGLTESTVTNTVTVSSPLFTDLAPGNNSSTTTTVIRTQHADFGVAVHAPASAAVFGQFDVSVTLTNNGPDSGNNGISGTLPAGLTFFNTSDPACNGSYGGRTFSCGAGSMAPSTSKTFVVTVASDATQGDQTITVRSSGGAVDDPDSSNDVATATTHVFRPFADLTVTTSGDTTAHIGDSVTYRLTVTNHGPDPATRVLINAYFRTAGFDGETATPSSGGACSIDRDGSGTFDGGTPTYVVCPVFDLAPGESWSIDIGLHVVANGTFALAGQAFPRETDPHTADNFSSLGLVVEAPHAPPVAVIASPSIVHTGSLPATVTLDGSRSHDVNGDPLTFAWTSDCDAPVDHPSSSVVQLTFTSYSACTVRVTVDNGFFQSSASANVSIVDTTPPVLSAPLDATVAQDAHESANVATFLAGATATDDGGAPVTIANDYGAGPAPAPGAYLVTWTATDASGNSATAHATLTIVDSDTTPPVISPILTGTLGNGWYTSDVGVTWSVADAESAIGSTSGCGASLVTVDTAGTTFTCTATSAGGTTTRSVTVKRDATAPVVSYTGNTGAYGLTDTVAIRCAASDTLSGLAGSTCVDVTGPAYGFGAGSHTYFASATDAAGNTATAGATFTVAVTAGSLCTLTKQLVQESTKYRALPAAARAAANALATGLCVKLDAILPKATPAQKAALVGAYKLGVAALANAGWLTQAQATSLGGLAGKL